MSSDDRIPQDLLDDIIRARQRHQPDVNYSNGAEPWAPTWDHLPELLEGVKDDPTVKRRIQHLRETGRLPREWG
jgi:hypothetical protein